MRLVVFAVIVVATVLTSATSLAQSPPDDGTPPLQPPRADLVGVRAFEVQFRPDTPPEEQAAAHRAAGAIPRGDQREWGDGYIVTTVVVPSIAAAAARHIYLSRPSVRIIPVPPPPDGGWRMPLSCPPEEIAAGRSTYVYGLGCLTPQGVLNLYPVTAWVVFRPDTSVEAQTAAHEAAGAAVWAADAQPGGTIALITVPVRTQQEAAQRYDGQPGVRGIITELDTLDPVYAVDSTTDVRSPRSIPLVVGAGSQAIRETMSEWPGLTDGQRSTLIRYVNASAYDTTVAWQGVVPEPGVEPAVRGVVLSPGGTRIRLLSLSEGIVCATVAENFLVCWAIAGRHEVMFSVDEPGVSVLPLILRE